MPVVEGRILAWTNPFGTVTRSWGCARAVLPAHHKVGVLTPPPSQPSPLSEKAERRQPWNRKFFCSVAEHGCEDSLATTTIRGVPGF